MTDLLDRTWMTQAAQHAWHKAVEAIGQAAMASGLGPDAEIEDETATVDEAGNLVIRAGIGRMVATLAIPPGEWGWIDAPTTN